MFRKPISWFGIEEQNLTQQKHTFTNQKKRTTTQNKHKKLKPGLVASYDIWPAFGASRICHLFTYLDTYPLTYSPRHGDWVMKTTDHNNGKSPSDLMLSFTGLY